MKLTGKCKEDFEKWYINQLRHQRTDYVKYSDNVLLRKFYRKPNNEKFGVYVDLFDIVGVEVEVRKVKKSSKFISFSALSTIEWALYQHDTRPEARIKAIEKANELYNSL